MTPEQGTAFLQAQIACALIELESMKAANEERRYRGHADAYGEQAFVDLIEKYPIGNNAALKVLWGE